MTEDLQKMRQMMNDIARFPVDALEATMIMASDTERAQWDLAVSEMNKILHNAIEGMALLCVAGAAVNLARRKQASEAVPDTQAN